MADGGTDRELPLAGVLICCTGLPPEERTRIASVAAQMGASHTFDLTANVTHLIVSTPDTEKYRYVARERNDIKVLQPDFVDAVRLQWMSGGDANIQQLEEEYRFRTFQGTKICVTGWDDYDYRMALGENLRNNGAFFQRDLTKDATHLIAKSPSGRKFEYATLWGIKVVSMKWVEDSLARGMILDENRYHPSIPLEKQGQGAWRRPPPPSIEPAPKRTGPIALSQRARKIRRVASMKLGSQSEGLWGAIMAEDNKPDHSAAATSEKDAWKEEPKVEPNDRQQSDREESKENNSSTIEPSVAPTDGASSAAAHPTKSSRTSPHPESRGFWYNCRFFIYGFTTKQTNILVDHMTARDAEIVKTPQELSLPSQTEFDTVQRYALVPFAYPRHQLPSLDDVKDVKFVNDLWIEKCLHHNTFIAPEKHAICTPFKSIPLSGFQGLVICSTGFTGIDLLHLSKIVKLMGAKYDEYLTPNASVLICSSTADNSREKLRHVANWNIPAVFPDWIWDSVRAGARQPYEKYLLQKWEPKRRSLDQGLNGNKKSTPRGTSSPKTTTQVPAKDIRYGPFAVSQDNEESGHSDAHQELVLPQRSRPQSQSPQKSSTGKENKTEDSEQTRFALDNAINTLLRKNSKEKAGDGSDTSSGVIKKRRQLMGRASSNASMTLTGRFGQSREQSVDTTSADLTGNLDPSNIKTGKEPSEDTSKSLPGPSLFGPPTLESDMANPYMTQFDEDSQPKTQLRYQDPDAAALKAVMMPNTTAIDKNDLNETFDPEAQKQRELLAARLREREIKHESISRRLTRSTTKTLPTN